MLAETDLSGNNVREFIYFGGRRIARRDNSGAVYYFSQDHLGTARVMTNSTGVTLQESTYYPFGGEQRVVTNVVDNRYKFTGMERDSESGLDHTLFRMYPSNLARWLSPDPVAGDVTNPQSLNRYAYVLNNPTNFIDPLGLGAGDPMTCYWAGDRLRCDPVGPGPGGTGGPGGGAGPAHEPIQDVEPAREPGRGRGWPQAPEEGTADLPSLGERPIVPPNVSPDFVQLTVNVGSIIGATGIITIDRYGRLYIGIGGNLGKSATGLSGSLTPGWLFNDPRSYRPADRSSLYNFLTGAGCSLGGGYWLGGFANVNRSGEGFTAGGVTPQAGVSCTYSRGKP